MKYFSCTFTLQFFLCLTLYSHIQTYFDCVVYMWQVYFNHMFILLLLLQSVYVKLLCVFKYLIFEMLYCTSILIMNNHII